MNVFIIGSGFTKAIFPCAPLNGELLNAIAANDSNNSSSKLLKRYETKDIDIEIALTRLDIEITQVGSSEREKLTQLRKDIVGELGNFFGAASKFCASDSLITEKPWLADFINRCFKSGDVAISLNYDCVLEGALDCCGKWTPKGGYGDLIGPPLGCTIGFSESPVKVLKLHGSASFEEGMDIGKPQARPIGLGFYECFFPRSAHGKNFGLVNGTTYIIAPSYVKIPTVEIAYLMLDAIKATANAENLIVIGCSLRPEDSFLRVLLANFGRQGPHERKIIIVDPEAKKIAKGLGNFWSSDVEGLIVPIPSLIQTSVSCLVNSISNINYGCG